jgi:hypothetical protein
LAAYFFNNNMVKAEGEIDLVVVGTSRALTEIPKRKILIRSNT